jgi:hypothetical protein
LKEAEMLLKMLQKILRKAIELRGSTISDFVDGDGLAGEYQQHHKVYGRDGQKCCVAVRRLSRCWWRGGVAIIVRVPAGTARSETERKKDETGEAGWYVEEVVARDFRTKFGQ